MMRFKKRPVRRIGKKVPADPELLRMREGLTALTDSLEKLAAGNLDVGEPVLPEGVSEETAAVLNRAGRVQQAFAASIWRLQKTAGTVEKRVGEGDFSQKANPDDYLGCFSPVVASLNRAFSGIVLPMRSMSQLIRQMAEGNLAGNDKTEYKGEFAAFYQSMQTLQGNYRQEREKIAATTRMLDEKAVGMVKLAENLARVAEQSQQQSMTVVSATDSISSGMTQSTATLSTTSSNISGIASSVEEMSSTIRNLAAASEEMSTSVNEVSRLVGDIHGNVQNVSDSSGHISQRVDDTVRSIREISQSLDEVGGHCEKALQIAGKAGETAKHTNDIISKLNESSQQIGKVVSLINEIASQTNILALNAAIEAASAGDAGRGFAVVANEVKELAKQTADATGDIRQQIDTMQQNMSEAVKAVSDINRVIDDITGISGTIASAVTQQTASAAQISTSATEAAADLTQMTERIGTVAKETEDVSHSTEESAKGVEDVARSASELSKAAETAAKSSETASSALSEVDDAMAEMLKGVVNISEQMHAAEATIGKDTESADRMRQYSREISDLSKQLSRALEWVQAHE